MNNEKNKKITTSFLHVYYPHDEARNDHGKHRRDFSSGDGSGSRDDFRLPRQVGLDVVGLHFRRRTAHPDWRRQFLFLVRYPHSEIVKLPETLAFEEVRLACQKRGRIMIESW